MICMHRSTRQPEESPRDSRRTAILSSGWRQRNTSVSNKTREETLGTRTEGVESQVYSGGLGLTEECSPHTVWVQLQRVELWVKIQRKAKLSSWFSGKRGSAVISLKPRRKPCPKAPAELVVIEAKVSHRVVHSENWDQASWDCVPNCPHRENKLWVRITEFHVVHIWSEV